MKKSIFILMAVVLGMTACNDAEKVSPSNTGNDFSSLASVAPPPANYLTLAEIEASLIPYGVEEVSLPIGYVPIFVGFTQIKCYVDLASTEFYYVYVFPSAGEVDPNAAESCISQWHSNEGKKGACYNPGSDCRFGGYDKDRETIIICC